MRFNENDTESFEGVIVDDSNSNYLSEEQNLTTSVSNYKPEWKTKKLYVKQMKLRADGQLTIFFNKAIRPLPIKSSEASQNT